MIVTEITNHVQQALQRFLQQYQGQPRLTGLMTALVQQIQLLENALYVLDAQRQLYNGQAVGAQLDALGTIIGLQRNGLDDAEYFILLIGTIAENNSDTTQPTLLNIVQTVFSTPEVFCKTPNSPGGGYVAAIAFGVGSPAVAQSLYTLIETIVLNSIGAGISLVYISRFNSQHAFSTAGPQAWCSGCSDLNNPQPTDGVIGSLIYNNPAG